MTWEGQERPRANLPPQPQVRDTVRPNTLGPDVLEFWLRINPEISKVETSEDHPCEGLCTEDEPLSTVIQLSCHFLRDRIPMLRLTFLPFLSLQLFVF